MYVQEYPLVRTFVYTTGALSAIPVALFSVYVAMTLLGSVVTAILGVILLEGGMITFGLAVLVPIEFCILTIAGGATVAYATGRVGLKQIERIGDRLIVMSDALVDAKKSDGSDMDSSQ